MGRESNGLGGPEADEWLFSGGKMSRKNLEAKAT